MLQELKSSTAAKRFSPWRGSSRFFTLYLLQILSNFPCVASTTSSYTTNFAHFHKFTVLANSLPVQWSRPSWLTLCSGDTRQCFFISYCPNRSNKFTQKVVIDILSVNHLRTINHLDLCFGTYLVNRKNKIFSLLIIKQAANYREEWCHVILSPPIRRVISMSNRD